MQRSRDHDRDRDRDPPFLRFTLIAACIVAFGCDRGAEPDPQPPPDSSTIADSDTTILPADISAYGEEGLDSLRVRIDSVEAELARAPAARQPQLLLSLGRLKRLYIPNLGTPQASYAEAHPDEFFYDEIGGSYLYNGKDLRALIERYPDSPLVDDAAYALTLLPLGGECEGFVTCYIASAWMPVRPFLTAYATSPYAPRALERVIAAFDEHLKDVPDLRTATEFYDPDELRPLVAEFDSVAAGLPPTLRARATEAIGRVRQRLERGPQT